MPRQPVRQPFDLRQEARAGVVDRCQQTAFGIIFRRLWRLPAAGFAALLRKLVSNEVLLGYSGELSFYAWARRHGTLTATPFGAIKDVSILSAFAGNLATLAMTALAWPFLGLLNIGALSHAMLISTVIIVAVAVLMVVFGRRVFSLPAADLRFIFAVHTLRLLATTLLSGLIWHAALPDIGLGMWVLLAAMQLLVTRLPFVPNKDLMFASMSFALIGHDARISILLGLVAALILVTHLLIGSLLAIAELQPDRNR